MLPVGYSKTFVANLAFKAGEIISKHFITENIETTWKEDETPLTIADKLVNDLVLEKLSKTFPGTSIMGEEGSLHVENAEYVWLCDPIDGTIPFRLGIPISTFCLSLLRNGAPVMGCIYDPFKKKMFYAEKGNSAFCNRDKIAVSQRQDLRMSHIAIEWWEKADYKLDCVMQDLTDQGMIVIHPQSIAYFCALVASGKIEATLFPGNKPLETAAAKIIVEEAGGRVTDLYGVAHQDLSQSIHGHIVSNGCVHETLIEAIQRHRSITAKEYGEGCGSDGGRGVC